MKPAALPPLESQPELISVEAAAPYYGMSRATAYKHHRDGTLPGGATIGNRRVVRTRALVRWLEGTAA